MKRHVIIALCAMAPAISHSRTLRVLMPKSVEDRHQDELLGELEHAMGTKREQTIAYVSATIGVGCTCPPWEWSAIHLSFVWPRYARGVPEMPRIHGAFRLTGYVEGQKRDGFQVYNKPRPKKAMYDDGHPLEGKHPVFFVDEWCWEYSGGELFEHEVDDIAELRDQGLVCAGSNTRRLHRELQRATASR